MNSVLVTGGTGTFGQAFVRRLLTTDAERVVIYSRGEHKQERMRQELDPEQERLRFAIGDVRDYRRLAMAMRGIDTVVHAAALKVVPLLEANPTEALRTNAEGAVNVIEAAIHAGVECVVALGSDKGASPINAYGATKLAAEKAFLAANAYSGLSTRFSCTRYGNVTGSAGSVVPFWKEKLARGEPLPVTDSGMTRFWMTIEEAVDLVLYAYREGTGGEVFVPELPAYRVADLAEAMAPGHPTEVVGLRPGEKRHEVMISADEAGQAWRMADGGYRLIPGAWAVAGERLTEALSSDGARRMDVAEIRMRLAVLGGKAAGAAA